MSLTHDIVGLIQRVNDLQDQIDTLKEFCGYDVERESDDEEPADNMVYIVSRRKPGTRAKPMYFDPFNTTSWVECSTGTEMTEKEARDLIRNSASLPASSKHQKPIIVPAN